MFIWTLLVNSVIYRLEQFTLTIKTLLIINILVIGVGWGVLGYSAILSYVWPKAIHAKINACCCRTKKWPCNIFVPKFKTKSNLILEKYYWKGQWEIIKNVCLCQKLNWNHLTKPEIWQISPKNMVSFSYLVANKKVAYW